MNRIHFDRAFHFDVAHLHFLSQPMRFIYFVVKLLHILESENSATAMSYYQFFPRPFIHNLSVLLYSSSSFSMICICWMQPKNHREGSHSKIFVRVSFLMMKRSIFVQKLKSESWFDFKCYRRDLQKVFDWFDDGWNVFVYLLQSVACTILKWKEPSHTQTHLHTSQTGKLSFICPFSAYLNKNEKKNAWEHFC